MILSDSLATKLAGRPRGQASGETIVFGRKESARTLRAALTLGAGDYVVWPEGRLRLREIVEHERAIPGEPPHTLGSLHAVWAPKGGSGSTVVAGHLAGAMAMMVAKCHLIDLDLDHSDQTAIRGAEDESNSILDLLRLGEELSTAMVERIAWAHPDGFKAILGPDPRQRSSSIDPAELMRVVTTVRETADHVIVDLPSGMSGVTIRVLRTSQLVSRLRGWAVRAGVPTPANQAGGGGSRGQVFHETHPRPAVGPGDGILDPVTGIVTDPKLGMSSPIAETGRDFPAPEPK